MTAMGSTSSTAQSSSSVSPSRSMRLAAALTRALRRVGALLARPDAEEVLPRPCAAALDEHLHHGEDHALQGHRRDDALEGRVARRGLRRLLVVDALPDLVEDLAPDDAAEDAQDEPDGLIDERHVEVSSLDFRRLVPDTGYPRSTTMSRFGW